MDWLVSGLVDWLIVVLGRIGRFCKRLIGRGIKWLIGVNPPFVSVTDRIALSETVSLLPELDYFQSELST